jgi:hypothetical protein
MAPDPTFAFVRVHVSLHSTLYFPSWIIRLTLRLLRYSISQACKTGGGGGGGQRGLTFWHNTIGLQYFTTTCGHQTLASNYLRIVRGVLGDGFGIFCLSRWTRANWPLSRTWHSLNYILYVLPLSFGPNIWQTDAFFFILTRWTNAERTLNAMWTVNGKWSIHSECFRRFP